MFARAEHTVHGVCTRTQCDPESISIHWGSCQVLRQAWGMWRVNLKQGASWELGQMLRCSQSHVPLLFLEDGNEISLRRKKMAEKINNLNDWSVNIYGFNL